MLGSGLQGWELCVTVYFWWSLWRFPCHGQCVSLADELDLNIIAVRFAIAKHTLAWETHMVVHHTQVFSTSYSAGC